MNVNVDECECDESSLVFNTSKEVDSTNFKNAIIQFQLPFELPEFGKDIEEMIIEEEFGNDYYGNLVIQNYPNLQSFKTGYQSFRETTDLSLSSNSIQFYLSFISS